MNVLRLLLIPLLLFLGSCASSGKVKEYLPHIVARFQLQADDAPEMNALLAPEEDGRAKPPLADTRIGLRGDVFVYVRARGYGIVSDVKLGVIILEDSFQANEWLIVIDRKKFRGKKTDPLPRVVLETDLFPLGEPEIESLGLRLEQIKQVRPEDLPPIPQPPQA